MEPGDLGVEPEADVRSDPRRVGPDQGCAGPTRDAVRLIGVTKGDQGRAPQDADPAAFGATPRRSLHCRGPETRVRRAARHSLFIVPPLPQLRFQELRTGLAAGFVS